MQAQLNLGAMYSKGQGIRQDFVQAHKWLNLAAAAGEKEAQNDMKTIEVEMTSKQIEKARLLAQEWWAQHR